MFNFLQNLHGKIFNNIIFPYDKIIHFIAGMILAAFSAYFMGASVIILYLPIVMGIAKEVYDFYHQPMHAPEFADFCCTAAGGAVFLVILDFILKVF